MAMARLQDSYVWSTMLPESWYEPALLTRMSSPPPRSMACVDAGAGRRLVGDVEVDRVGAVAALADGRRHLRRAIRIDVGHDDVGAGRGKHPGDALPDPGCRSGDESDLAVEGEELRDRVVHRTDGTSHRP